VLYLCNPSTDAITASMQRGELGFIDTPAQRQQRVGSRWCADNGCFGKGYPGDEAWLAWLARQAAERDAALCVFATAPDVVADFAATWARSRPWLSRIRELGLPAALVAQDGMSVDTFDGWDELDVLFVGGSTEWKLGAAARALVAEAKRRGKHVHMGRVNSRKRLRYAQAIGVDSCDGTLLTFGPDKHLPSLLRWLAQLEEDSRRDPAITLALS
jgi:hypothetical protein